MTLTSRRINYVLPLQGNLHHREHRVPMHPLVLYLDPLLSYNSVRIHVRCQTVTIKQGSNTLSQPLMSLLFCKSLIITRLLVLKDVHSQWVTKPRSHVVSSEVCTAVVDPSQKRGPVPLNASNKDNVIEWIKLIPPVIHNTTEIVVNVVWT